MKKTFCLILFLVSLLIVSLPAFSQAVGKYDNFCEMGGKRPIVAGSTSTTTTMQSIGGCTVEVFIAGTATPATIYSDSILTPKSNPFTADPTTSYYFFYASVLDKYDVRISGGTSPNALTSPFTRGDQAISGVTVIQVQEEGVNLAPRGTHNWIGSGVTAADDPGNLRTNFTVATPLNNLASNVTNGCWSISGGGSTGAARTFVGTANRIVITNGNCSANPQIDIGTNVVTLADTQTLVNKTLTSAILTNPTITGGTHTALTSLGIRSTGTGAFDLLLRNTENLTANRFLTITLNNVDRLVNLGGNLTTVGAFTTGGVFTTGSTFTTTGAVSLAGPFSTTGASSLTLNTTGVTNVTFPLSGTLATLAGTETLSNKTLPTPRITTSLLDTNGNTWLSQTATGSAVNNLNLSNAAVGTNGGTISSVGSGANLDITLTPKGTGKLGVGTPGASPVAGIIGGPDASGTNTAGVNLNLAGGVGTGNAVPGQVAVAYPLITTSGSTVQSLSTSRYPLVTSMYTNTGIGVVINNTTTETSFFQGAPASAGSTLTIEAGSVRVGTVYRISLFGQMVTSGTPTLRIRVKVGSVVAGDTTAFTTLNSISGQFYLECDLFITAIGASGSGRPNVRWTSYSTPQGVATTQLAYGQPLGGTFAIDTTVPQLIDVTAQWGTANVNNNVTMITASIERLR